MKTLLHWAAERFPVNPDTLKQLGSEPVPMHLKHWWWCLGGTPAYLLLVQIATGILLAFYYVPTPEAAYESVRHINTAVPFGWFIRSLHKWSSNFFIIAVILHMMRVFFTGSYRRPRELNWMVGLGLLFCALMWGFTGYSLIYEQLSYWGATVAGNITESIPFIGVILADFIRGGDKVGPETLTRFYVFHIGVIPTLAFGLVAIHLAMVRLHGVTEFRFQADENTEKKTFAFFPDHFLSEIGIAVFLMAVLTLFAIIFPAGLGPEANPLVTPANIKPEWYFFFTFRWLKLTSLPIAVLSLGLAGLLLFSWPFIDKYFRHNNTSSELSVWLGTLGIVIIVILTVWEAVVLAMHH